MVGVGNNIKSLRGGLFAKYVILLVGLVFFVLAVNGAIETWISYRGTKSTLTDAMGEKAETTARRIEQSIADLERQISWVTRAYSDTLEKHHADYVQLLNQVPAVSQLSWLDGNGREQLKLSRTRISVGSKADFSGDPRFTDTVAHNTSFPRLAALYVDRGLAFRLQRRRHRRRHRPWLPVGLPRRVPCRQGRLRLCGRRPRPGAGEFGQGPRNG
jgi:hypothetical protein